MPVMEAIARHATKPLDVHLMIVDPDRYIQTFADLGADVLTVHAEACTPSTVRSTPFASWHESRCGLEPPHAGGGAARCRA